MDVEQICKVFSKQLISLDLSGTLEDGFRPAFDMTFDKLEALNLSNIKILDLSAFGNAVSKGKFPKLKNLNIEEAS
jgi:inhibitor of KinA sporulation pathway (predicted exonuclease)